MVSPLSGMSLQGAPSNTLNSILAGRQSYEQSQLNSQALAQGKQQIDKAEQEKAVQKITVMKKLAEKARSLDPSERYRFVQSLNPEMLKSVGINPADLPNQQLDDKSLDDLISQTSAALPEVKSTGEAASFNEMTKNLTKDEREQARRINLGLDPRATGSAAQTIANRGLTDSVGASEAEIARQKALATGGVDLGIKPEITRRQAQAEADVERDTKPQITKAVETAKNEADAAAKAKETQRKNSTALAMYEQGIQSVNEALGGTETGYIAGRLPAVTANQQKAEGAISAMAPILKDLFREAGEGTFTKPDQDILMAMLPTTKDEPEARAAKIKNVDALVKIKLQGGSGQGGATPGINSEAKATDWNTLP